MKVKIEVEATQCDICTKVCYTRECIVCRKDYCHECRFGRSEMYGVRVHQPREDGLLLCTSCIPVPTIKLSPTLTRLLDNLELIRSLTESWKEKRRIEVIEEKRLETEIKTLCQELGIKL